MAITGCANSSCVPPYIELAVVSALGKVGASGMVGASGRPKLDSYPPRDEISSSCSVDIRIFARTIQRAIMNMIPRPHNAIFFATAAKPPDSSESATEMYRSAVKSIEISVLSSVASTFSVAVKIMVS